MFEHFIAGELIFLFLGKQLGFNITPAFLLFGSFCGFLPDLISYFLSRHIHYNKRYYSHRDNFSHSIFFPILIFAATAFPFGWRISLLIFLATLSHPLLDLYGLGWGVKLFLPISDKIYKLFFKKKIIYIYRNNDERNHDVEKFQSDDWFQKVYFGFFRHHKESKFRRGLKFFGPDKWWDKVFSNFDSAPKWWGFSEWVSLVAAICLPVFYFLKK